MPRWQRETVKGGGKFCSRPCKHAGSTVPRERLAAEVTRHSAGYLLEWAPGHPRARHGRVLQHILVMEAMLGRSLAGDEEVHHVNGRRDDNRPENLEVVKRGLHQSMHWQDPAFRAAQSERMRRHVATRRRDPATGRLLPN